MRFRCLERRDNNIPKDLESNSGLLQEKQDVCVTVTLSLSLSLSLSLFFSVSFPSYAFGLCSFFFLSILFLPPFDHLLFPSFIIFLLILFSIIFLLLFSRQFSFLSFLFPLFSFIFIFSLTFNALLKIFGD